MFEIGPGLGALTKPILSLIKKLLVIEIDKKLVNYLSKNFSKKQLKIFPFNVLKFDFKNIFVQKKKY